MAREEKLIEVKVVVDDAIRKLSMVEENIKNLTTEQKNLNRATEQGKIRNAEIAVQLKNENKERSVLIKEISKEINIQQERAKIIDRNVLIESKANQKAEADATKKVGYINQLKIAVKQLEEQYYRLTEAELKGAKGKEVLTALKDKRGELSQLNEAYGNYTMGVGNYGKATNNLSIQLGQVMKEMPNFTISARIGIMSLTNNLPMLAEAFQQVKVQQAQMIADGKKMPSMFSLITKSVFGLTGIVSLAMVALQLYGVEIIKLITQTSKADEAQKKFNKTLSEGDNFYTQAQVEIIEVENSLRLAEKGAIDGAKALETYNSKLGDTFGEATDVADALERVGQYKTEYTTALVAMAAAQDILTMAINKSSEALAMQRGEKPGFFQHLGTLGLTVARTFNPQNWGIMALPNFLEDVSNTSSLTWQTYYDKINKLRKESGEEILSYTEEVAKIAEKYKDDPFISELLGLPAPSLKGTKDKSDAERLRKEKFEKDYAAFKEQNQIISDIQESQFEIEKSLLKDGEKAIAEHEAAIKRGLINRENDFSESIDKGIKLLQDAYDYDEYLSDKSVEQALRNNQIKLQNEANALSDRAAINTANLDEQFKVEAEKRAFNMRQELSAAKITEEQKEIIRKKYEVLEEQASQDLLQKKFESIKRYAQAALAIGSELSNFSNAMAERELVNFAKMNAGKEGFEEQYAEKKRQLQVQGAKREKALGVFSAVISTAAAIIAALADKTLGAAGRIALSIAAGVTGAAQIATILATPIPTETSSGGGSLTGKNATSTAKFHSGGVAGQSPDSPTREQEITRTLLTSERVLSPKQTSIFDSMISSIGSRGGADSIVGGIGVNTSNIDVMYAAFSKALENMPAPIMVWQEFERQQQRQQRLKTNAMLK